MKDFSARFVEVVESLGQNGYKLDGVGCITKQKISNISNGLTDVKTEVVSDLCKAFPKVNANYILTGNGNMFLDEEPKGIQVTSEPIKGSIPFYKELPVSAGKMDILKAFVDKEEGQGWIQLPDVSAIAAFPVKGCSMEPYIMNGDFVAIAPVNRWDRVDPDKVYMIITKDDRMIKHLMVDNDDDSILWAVSPNYNKFRISKEEIVEIYRVVFYGRMA